MGVRLPAVHRGLGFQSAFLAYRMFDEADTGVGEGLCALPWHDVHGDPLTHAWSGVPNRYSPQHGRPRRAAPTFIVASPTVLTQATIRRRAMDRARPLRRPSVRLQGLASPLEPPWTSDHGRDESRPYIVGVRSTNEGPYIDA